MTSKQAMLVVIFTAASCLQLAACSDYRGASRRHKGQQAPYEQRQVWAVAPLRNESGNQFANGLRLADDLTQQLTSIRGIDVLPVNRVLAAMQALDMRAITAKADALALRQALGVDGLVVGTLTAWNPYDPPKIGIAVELYIDPIHPTRSFDTRKLTGAATEGGTIPDKPYRLGDQPVSTVSAYYDAADPITRNSLDKYGKDRGIEQGKHEHNARLYRISMDLYSEFVSHMVCSRLLHAERVRMTPPASQEPDQTGQPRQTNQLTKASP